MSNQVEAAAAAMAKGKTRYTYVINGTRRTGSLPRSKPLVGIKKPSHKPVVHAKGGRSRRRKNNRRGSGTRRRRHGKQQSLKSFFHF